MKIIGITACPTGIAHTYMAQECLEKEIKKRGFDAKIETQGGLGIENELTEDDVASADVVILAVSVVIEGEERFEGKNRCKRGNFKYCRLNRPRSRTSERGII